MGSLRGLYYLTSRFNLGYLRGAKPLFSSLSPSPLKERGIKGVR